MSPDLVAEEPVPQTLEALVEAYWPRVYAACRLRLRHHADAEDATQEVFRKLIESADGVNGHVGGWLMACARNTCVDHVRRGTRRRAREAATPRTETQPDHRLQHLETAEFVERLLAQLTDDERRLVRLHLFERVPQSVLASQDGVAQQLVSRRIRRAVDKMRDWCRTQARVMGIGGAVTAAVGLPSRAGVAVVVWLKRVAELAAPIGLKTTAAPAAGVACAALLLPSDQPAPERDAPESASSPHPSAALVVTWPVSTPSAPTTPRVAPVVRHPYAPPAVAAASGPTYGASWSLAPSTPARSGPPIAAGVANPPVPPPSVGFGAAWGDAPPAVRNVQQVPARVQVDDVAPTRRGEINRPRPETGPGLVNMLARIPRATASADRSSLRGLLSGQTAGVFRHASSFAGLGRSIGFAQGIDLVVNGVPADWLGHTGRPFVSAAELGQESISLTFAPDHVFTARPVLSESPAAARFFVVAGALPPGLQASEASVTTSFGDSVTDEGRPFAVRLFSGVASGLLDGDAFDASAALSDRERVAEPEAAGTRVIEFSGIDAEFEVLPGFPPFADVTVTSAAVAIDVNPDDPVAHFAVVGTEPSPDIGGGVLSAALATQERLSLTALARGFDGASEAGSAASLSTAVLIPRHWLERNALGLERQMAVSGQSFLLTARPVPEPTALGLVAFACLGIHRPRSRV